MRSRLRPMKLDARERARRRVEARWQLAPPTSTIAKSSRSVAIGMACALALFQSPPACTSPLWAVIDNGSLHESLDGGETWLLQSTLPATDVTSLAFGVDFDAIAAFAATASGSVYAGGPGAWGLVNSVASPDVVAMAVRGNCSIILLAASGTTWVDFSATHNLDGESWVSLTSWPGQSARLFAVSQSGQVAASADGGRTWQGVPGPGTDNAVEIVASNAGLYVLTGTGGVWRSTNASASWDSIASVGGNDLVSLVAEAGGLYACTRSGSVAASLDGVGWNWVGTVGSGNVVCLASFDLPTTIWEYPPPVEMWVGKPWPNPIFRGRGGVTFPVWTPESGTVSVTVFDVRGRRLASLGEHRVVPGVNFLRWIPSDTPRGVFYVRFVVAGGREQTVPLTIGAE